MSGQIQWEENNVYLQQLETQYSSNISYFEQAIMHQINEDQIMINCIKNKTELTKIGQIIYGYLDCLKIQAFSQYLVQKNIYDYENFKALIKNVMKASQIQKEKANQCLLSRMSHNYIQLSTYANQIKQSPTSIFMYIDTIDKINTWIFQVSQSLNKYIEQRILTLKTEKIDFIQNGSKINRSLIGRQETISTLPIRDQHSQPYEMQSLQFGRGSRQTKSGSIQRTNNLHHSQMMLRRDGNQRKTNQARNANLNINVQHRQKRSKLTVFSNFGAHHNSK